MADTRWIQERLAEFDMWQKLDSHFHTVTTGKRKFSRLRRRKYDDVVISYVETAGGAASEEPAWLRKRIKRHLQHRERAIILLSTPGFTDDFLTVAKRWQLDEHQYDVERFDFWDGLLTGLWCWRVFLFWVWAENCAVRADEIKASETRLAEKFLRDHNLEELCSAWKAFSVWTYYDVFLQDVRELAGKYGLSTLWDRSVVALLLSGQMPVPFDNCRLVVRTEETRRLFIEIYPETRKEDLDDLWTSSQQALDSLFPQRPKRHRRRRQLARDIQTQSDQARGKTIEEIVVQDYDLDAQADDFSSMRALIEEEDRVLMRLDKGAKRLTVAQREALLAAVEPVLKKRFRAIDDGAGERIGEWYPRPGH